MGSEAKLRLAMLPFSILQIRCGHAGLLLLCDEGVDAAWRSAGVLWMDEHHGASRSTTATPPCMQDITTLHPPVAVPNDRLQRTAPS